VDGAGERFVPITATLAFVRLAVPTGFRPVVQTAVASVEPALEDVGHGHELGRAVLDGQGVLRRAGATPAAADQGELDGVVIGSVNHRDGDAGQGGRGDGAAGR